MRWRAGRITIKTPSEILLMREAGRIAAAVAEKLREAIKPGITTEELDKIAEEEIRRRGAVPAFKGYRGFPASVCTSINEEVIHGIPGRRKLKEGDIISLDLGICLRGYYADHAFTVGVGKIKPLAQRLIKVTEEALRKGIEAARSGARLGDVSAAIQQHIEKNGFSVIREYVGHGIGRNLHEEPPIPNYGSPGRGPLLHKGMTLALEPMVSAGHWKTRVKEDGWTVVTADGSLAAHFEHTIVVGDGKAEILTIL